MWHTGATISNCPPSMCLHKYGLFLTVVHWSCKNIPGTCQLILTRRDIPACDSSKKRETVHSGKRIQRSASLCRPFLRIPIKENKLKKIIVGLAMVFWQQLQSRKCSCVAQLHVSRFYMQLPPGTAVLPVRSQQPQYIKSHFTSTNTNYNDICHKKRNKEEAKRKRGWKFWQEYW